LDYIAVLFLTVEAFRVCHRFKSGMIPAAQIFINIYGRFGKSLLIFIGVLDDSGRIPESQFAVRDGLFGRQDTAGTDKTTISNLCTRSLR